MMSKVARDRGSILTVCAAIMMVGGVFACAPSAPPPPPPPPAEENHEPAAVEHQVSFSGETLAMIAAWYTGKNTNWTIIRDANPGLRPERMNLGQRIVIPGRIVVRREPMPRRFLQDTGSKSRRPSATTDVSSETPPVNSGGGTGDTVGIAPSSPPDTVGTAGGGDADFDRLLEEAQRRTDTPSSGTPSSGTPGSPPSVDTAPPSGGTAASPPVTAPPPQAGDAEREQLLDELLTQ